MTQASNGGPYGQGYSPRMSYLVSGIDADTRRKDSHLTSHLDRGPMAERDQGGSVIEF